MNAREKLIYVYFLVAIGCTLFGMVLKIPSLVLIGSTLLALAMFFCIGVLILAIPFWLRQMHKKK